MGDSTLSTVESFGARLPSARKAPTNTALPPGVSCPLSAATSRDAPAGERPAAWETSAWAKGPATVSSPTSAPAPETSTTLRLATGKELSPSVLVVVAGDGGS
jgi:hypothetical protein